MIKAFFQLIRWPNLFLLVLSMYLMYVPIVQHLMGIRSATAGLDTIGFLLLVTATLLLAAGGYIINDMEDVEADNVNKPGKNNIGTMFTVQQAQVLYTLTTLGGVAAGALVSFRVDRPEFVLIFLFTAGLMWSYAKGYQYRPLLGNLLVAFPSASSFGLVFLFQVLALQNQTVDVGLQAYRLTLHVTLVYISFAFLVSLLREVVKDMEDIEGDRLVGSRTFVIVYGLQKAKNLSLTVAFVGLIASFLMQWVFLSQSLLLLFYYFFLVDFLFGYIIYKLMQAKEKKDYAALSRWIKLLMLTGVLSMALFYFGG